MLSKCVYLVAFLSCCFSAAAWTSPADCLPACVCVIINESRSGVVPIFPSARLRGVPSAAAAAGGRPATGIEYRRRRRNRNRNRAGGGGVGLGSGRGGPLGLLRAGTRPVSKVCVGFGRFLSCLGGRRWRDLCYMCCCETNVKRLQQYDMVYL